MKKVCIVTICNGSNFGNRLQNYALQEVLEQNFKVKAMTARNISGEIGKRFIKHKPVLSLLQSGFVSFAADKFLKNARLRKKFKFLRFNKKYVNMTSKSIDSDAVPANFSDQFNCFIAGSDQIWNPEFDFNSSVEYLNFAPKEKKVAYAASFGVSELTDQQQQYTANMLSEFQHISVREVSALSILKKVGHDDARLVLDPTMLLTAEQWSKLEKRPSFIKGDKPYVLNYILNVDNTDAKDFSKKLCAENGWNVIDINDVSQYMHYGIGPEEFLYLIHHAEYICTDSFHASVFSSLFHRNFTVFTRGNMNSRIASLLHMLTDGRELSWGNGCCTPELDYDLADSILDCERSRSVEFLRESLSAINVI